MTRPRDPLPTDVTDLPPLPAEYDDVVAEGLAALGLTLNEAALAAIADHVRLLLAWTAAINLTAIREPVAAAREHVLDSLTALPLLRSRNTSDLLDIGSGGGFPGIPLALALPRARTVLVESVGKKATFLAAVLDALELRPRVAVAATRAETLAADPHHRGRWSTVVVRAVGPLAELAELSLPLLAPGGVMVAWKRQGEDRRPDRDGPDGRGGSDGPVAQVGAGGRDLGAEIGAAEPVIVALGGGRPRIEPVAVPGLLDHVLVVIEKVGPTPAGYPRDPATRRRPS